MTAELAAALPAVALVLAICLGGVALLTRQAVLADAAADASRAVARGEADARAAAIIARVAPGAGIRLERSDGFVCVHVRDPAPVALLPLDASARACALEGGW
ncbi:TadE family type IV pilus minor pilin [Agromyces mangrovi Wang et al. 2018]|uniref:TadE family type IV pilus minor pilin n=1 Tax=Agromyces mangrovi TaxID=1858653 RepID=UPI0025730F1C|nr:TadE family type IV pilus minor pilin [Agromyces mangrovi]BDZ65697.1 hypothetical protein GCM10025877_26350 [Agromyces mangrovi]